MDHGRQIVGARCERAARAGVDIGMTIAHARALLPRSPEPLLEPHRPDRDDAALGALAAWLLRFSPIAAPSPPGCVLLDIAGCERAFRGERRIVRLVAEAMRRMRLHARIGVAPTYACARAVAMFAPEAATIVADGAVRAALEHLPLRAIDPEPEAERALMELGVERLGQLFDLPRASLPGRFGAELLMRMDRALGAAIETIDPVREPDPPRAARLFEGPTTQTEALALAARQALDDLCLALRSRERGARRIEVLLLRIDAPPVRFAIALSRPARDPRHLWTLLAARLERVNLGFGVEGVEMTAAALGRLPHEQDERWTEHAARTSAATTRATGELIDTIVDRLGAESVLRPEPVESHLPERAQRLRPAMLPPLRPAALDALAIAHAPRPTALLDPAEEALVLAVTPDGPVAMVRWRDRERRIATSLGPERLAQEWWRDERRASVADLSTLARDYFAVQDEDGLWLWIYRDGDTAKWFVHGLWA